MKNLFKKLNRGLILGAIVLVGFVAFVIIDTTGFKKNKPQIEDTVKSYINSMAEMAVTTSKEDFQSQAQKLIDDYWCADNSTEGMNINYFRSNLDTIAANNYSEKKRYW